MSLGSELAPNDYLNLPEGVRFLPKKKDRIKFVTLKNMGSFPIDGPIPTVDLYDYEPGDLPYKKPFFSWRDPLQGKGKQYKRKTKTGYWKSTCRDKEKLDKCTGQCIEKKKTLVFYSKSKRTQWILYEYSLPNQIGGFVINFLKKKKMKKDKVDTPESSEGHLEIHGQTLPDENGHQLRSRPWSPDSSFPHGGQVAEAPPATQALDGQTKHDLQLQYSSGEDIQLGMLLRSTDENFWEKIYMASLTCSSALGHRSHSS